MIWSAPRQLDVLLHAARRFFWQRNGYFWQRKLRVVSVDRNAAECDFPGVAFGISQIFVERKRPFAVPLDVFEGRRFVRAVAGESADDFLAFDEIQLDVVVSQNQD